MTRAILAALVACAVADISTTGFGITNAYGTFKNLAGQLVEVKSVDELTSNLKELAAVNPDIFGLPHVRVKGSLLSANSATIPTDSNPYGIILKDSEEAFGSIKFPDPKNRYVETGAAVQFVPLAKKLAEKKLQLSSAPGLANSDLSATIGGWISTGAHSSSDTALAENVLFVDVVSWYDVTDPTAAPKETRFCSKEASTYGITGCASDDFKTLPFLFSVLGRLGVITKAGIKVEPMELWVTKYKVLPKFKSFCLEMDFGLPQSEGECYLNSLYKVKRRTLGYEVCKATKEQAKQNVPAFSELKPWKVGNVLRKAKIVQRIRKLMNHYDRNVVSFAQSMARPEVDWATDQVHMMEWIVERKQFVEGTAGGISVMDVVATITDKFERKSASHQLQSLADAMQAEAEDDKGAEDDKLSDEERQKLEDAKPKLPERYKWLRQNESSATYGYTMSTIKGDTVGRFTPASWGDSIGIMIDSNHDSFDQFCDVFTEIRRAFEKNDIQARPNPALFMCGDYVIESTVSAFDIETLHDFEDRVAKHDPTGLFRSTYFTQDKVDSGLTWEQEYITTTTTTTTAQATVAPRIDEEEGMNRISAEDNMAAEETNRARVETAKTVVEAPEVALIAEEVKVDIESEPEEEAPPEEEKKDPTFLRVI